MNETEAASVAAAGSKVNTSTSKAGDQGYSIGLLLLGCLLLTFYAGQEFNTMSFIPTFAVFCGLHFSQQDGALMLSAFSMAYSVTRAVCIFISTKIRAQDMLYADMLIIIIGNLILMMYSSTSATMFWAGILIMGTGNGSVMPAIFPFLSGKMIMTNTIVGIFTFSRSVSQSLYILLTGFLIQSSPLVFVYVNLVSSVLCCIILFVFQKKHPVVLSDAH